MKPKIPTYRFKQRGNRIESKHWAVEWVDLGEGWKGDYNPDDPEDEPLLRFDFYSRENRKSPWDVPQDSSYCTQVNADTPVEVRKKLLVYLLMEVIDFPPDQSIKKLCERLSWIEESWLENSYKYPIE